MNQTTDNTSKPRCTSFFPLQKLKGNQPALKMPAMHLAHLEQESIKRDEEAEGKDLDFINGVTEEFMVPLTKVVKDAKTEEKHCYHCSSQEHFMWDCLFMKASRENTQLNHKEGIVPQKGAWAPQTK